MSRELKRVPLDFKYQIGETYSGYINPYINQKCNTCNGDGYSEDYNKLNDKWYSFGKEEWKPNPYREGARYNSIAWSENVTQEDVDALIEEDRLWDFTRVPLNDEQVEIVKQKIAGGGNSWLPFDNGYRPTAKEVNEWNLKGFGHDSLNSYIIIKARLKKQGKSHKCSKCNGTGNDWKSENEKELFENWKPNKLPTGEGFQLWSDLTPITPIFKSLEELCEYCEKEKVSTFGYSTATKQEWIDMLKNGLVFYKEGNNMFI